MFNIIPLNAECVDCLQNVDLSNKSELITCLVTIVIGAIIRVIEKRHDRKNRQNKP
jgi:hypothetical protein